MKTLLLKILTYTSAAILFLIALPFMLVFTLIKSFWIIFGSTILAFILIASFGGTMEECFQYSSALGFFVAIGLKFFEKNKD